MRPTLANLPHPDQPHLLALLQGVGQADPLRLWEEEGDGGADDGHHGEQQGRQLRGDLGHGGDRRGHDLKITVRGRDLTTRLEVRVEVPGSDAAQLYHKYTKPRS